MTVLIMTSQGEDEDYIERAKLEAEQLKKFQKLFASFKFFLLLSVVAGTNIVLHFMTFWNVVPHNARCCIIKQISIVLVNGGGLNKSTRI